jgi:DNA repair protein RadC
LRTSDPESSSADMAVTMDSIEALKALAITVNDHAIIGKWVMRALRRTV